MRLMRTLAALLFVSVLAACQGGIDDLSPKATKPLPAKIVAKMKAKGMEKTSPIYFRLFKDEHVVEVWKQKVNGKFEMIQNYNICAWSGTLGPKYKEGDRQAPEGFYAIKAPQMNPASQYYLSINTGFPNTYDRAHGRSGAHLMLHGACSSSGCYSLTDDNISEVFAFARDAFAGGQQEIMLEALPFRMTPEKMALYSKHKDFAFWQMIKEGYDYFELTKTPPKVGFCEKKYAFNKPEATNINAACPAPAQTPFAATYASYQSKYQSAYAAAAKKFEHTPFPIVMGGKSRPLTKKWEPQPVKPAKTALLPKPVKIKDDKAEEPAAAAPADATAEPAQDATATTAPVAAASVAETSPGVETAATVPVPTANPNAPAAEAAPGAPEKRKRRLWPFGNGS